MVKKVLEDNRAGKQLFLANIKNFCPNFIIDDDNREILSQICDWCLRIKQPVAKLDPNKGLWLYGYIGSGKSLMMECVLSFIKNSWVVRGYPYEESNLNPRAIGVTELCLKYAKDGYAAFDNIPVGLDEVGTEHNVAQHMGNYLNVFRYVIETLAKKQAFIPHIVTTNLSFDEVLTKYGPRVIDRIGTLFNPIFFQGDSRRPSKEIWDLVQQGRDAKMKK